MRDLDLNLSDGRTLHAYDTGADADGDQLTVVWHHGTPNIGTPPEPLFNPSARLGIRWISYDRPGYGASTRRVGRDVASAAVDAASVADAFGVDRFAVMGHSGGGSHALACGALLAERVLAIVVVAGLAPHAAGDLDWFGGMAPSGAASLRAALEGREAKERYEASAPVDDSAFTTVDHEALAGDWSWFGPVVKAGLAQGIGGLVDDDLASVAPWGFEPEQALAPILFVHGRQDRIVPCSHGEWLARHCRSAQLWLTPNDGHVSILGTAPAALEWLRTRAGELKVGAGA